MGFSLYPFLVSFLFKIEKGIRKKENYIKKNNRRDTKIVKKKQVWYLLFLKRDYGILFSWYLLFLK